MSTRPALSTAARTLGLGAGAAAVGTGAAWVGAASYLARAAVRPTSNKVFDQEVLEVGRDTVVLRATPDAVVPGRYGLWLADDGHARVHRILEHDRAAGTVRRELVAVDRGELRPGPARWNQYWYWDAPETSLGLPTAHISLETEVGPMPAWVVPPPGATPESRTQAARPGAGTGAGTGIDTGTWAVLLHGRAALREETLRAVPVLHRLGITAIVPGYRNDIDSPAAPDGRYALGLAEWRDAEAALAYALDHGATDVVVFGWSMGGAIALQLLDRSPLARHVSRVVLDSPVISWTDVLVHQAALQHVPASVVRLATRMMGHRRSRWLVGVHDPLDVARTDWQRRAADLHHPVLLIHSLDDEFVPVGPSLALAAARPDLVRLETWRVARHVKEWNVDPERWERLVAQWLTTDPRTHQTGEEARA